MSHFSGEDLIFYKDSNNGTIMSGGYLIDSIMLKNNISPMTTYNYKGGLKKDSENVSQLFENLAVPAGLFYINERTPIMETCEYQSAQPLSDDLHESLLALVEMSSKKQKIQSKKNKKSQFKKNQSYKKNIK